MSTAVKVNALFGKKTAAPAKPSKKAAAPAKPSKSGTSKSGGWLGSNSQNINLDKWCVLALRCLCTRVFGELCTHFRVG